MRPMEIANGGLALLLLTSAGCASWSTSPSMSQPFFIVDQSDARTFHMLAKKQDAVAARCQEQNSCDHAYFTRALIGLYESRDVAARYFEKVIAVAPKGQLAASSRLWLQQLQQLPGPERRSWITSVLMAPAIAESQVTMGHTSDRLVRDLLDREVMMQQLRASKDADAQALDQLQRELAERDRKADPSMGKKDAKGANDGTSIQSLQRQLAERDKKIDELSSQLEALKRIDQEMREKVRPIRPPSTVVPPATSEPTNP
jgi:bacterioferritin (cytochrome b1)